MNNYTVLNTKLLINKLQISSLNVKFYKLCCMQDGVPGIFAISDVQQDARNVACV